MTALVVYLSGVVFFAFQSAMCAPWWLHGVSELNSTNNKRGNNDL